MSNITELKKQKLMTVKEALSQGYTHCIRDGREVVCDLDDIEELVDEILSDYTEDKIKEMQSDNTSVGGVTLCEKKVSKPYLSVDAIQDFIADNFIDELPEAVSERLNDKVYSDEFKLLVIDFVGKANDEFYKDDGLNYWYGTGIELDLTEETQQNIKEYFENQNNKEVYDDDNLPPF